mgnify:CR=1 FL=1
MVIIMNPEATSQNIDEVIKAIKSVGLDAKIMEGAQQKIVGVIGDKTKLASVAIDALPGVENSVAISKSYKLASREFHSFQGLEVEGLKYLAEAREVTGLKIVTEVTTVEGIAPVADYADMLQIGARNMQNFGLLKEVGKCKRPVLLKRGLAATIDEWLNAAEYIMNAGNPDVVLCERGIRTYETYTRNTLDLSAVAAVKHLSHLPIIVDPSHGTGKWRMVKPMSLAAIAAGADGLMMEMHPNPARALSDGSQSLTPEHYRAVMSGIKKLAAFMRGENLIGLDE